MDVELNATEARVLGVLIEKGATTPDQYPLSLNAVTNGCNQKSNRDPVTDFSEAEVTVALTGLKFKHLVGATTPAGSRVEKYRHNAAEHLKLDPAAMAVLAELLLRGPQTKGELRQRASRMKSIDSLDVLAQVIARLAEAGYVRQWPPAAGSRAERFGQLLTDEAPPELLSGAPAAPASPASPAPATPSGGGLEARVQSLEEEVATLRRQLTRLADQLGEPLQED